MKLPLLLASALVAASVTAAKADSFVYTGFTVDPNNVQVTILSPVTKTVLAGQVTLDGSGPNAGTDLAVWCLDLFDTLQTGPYAYQETNVTAGLQLTGWTAPITSTQIQEIGDLMMHSGVNNDKAAEQVAIWSVLYGSSFSFLGSASLDADEGLDLAAVQSGGAFFDPNVTITALHDDVSAPNQTMGFAAVPGPVVGAGVPGLIAGILGMVGLARRRRKSVVA